MGHSLENSGFSLWGSQAVMVKHTVQPARNAARELGALLESQGLPGSTLIHRVRRHPTERGWSRAPQKAITS
jgi:hypothetical protein